MRYNDVDTFISPCVHNVAECKNNAYGDVCLIFLISNNQHYCSGCQAFSSKNWETKLWMNCIQCSALIRLYAIFIIDEKRLWHVNKNQLVIKNNFAAVSNCWSVIRIIGIHTQVFIDVFSMISLMKFHDKLQLFFTFFQSYN